MPNLLKLQVYAGLMEILNDKKYYYNSNVGPEFSHFTEEGNLALLEYMQIFAPTMIKKQEQESIKLAKAIVWDELKK